MEEEVAVAYVRVSDPRQLKGTSLETQEASVKRHAAYRGYKLIRIFVEEGRSAKSMRRKALNELFEFTKLRRNKIRVVIFPKIDRLARNTEDFLTLQRRIKSLGARLESAGEQIEDTPVGVFNATVQAAVAQLDNEIRAMRSYEGMVESARAGRWVWPAPVGYRTVRWKGEKRKGTGNIEPDPATSATIKEMFESFAAGKIRSMRETASFLSDRGIRTTESSAQRMLRRKAYIGVIESFGGEYRAAPPFVPIVQPATFYAVQAILDGRRNSPKVNDQYNEDFPLRGTVKCRCGGYLTANWANGRSRRYAYYRCMQCEKVNHRREKVEAAFVDFLSSLRPVPGRLPHIHRGLVGRAKTRTDGLRSERRRLESELAEIEVLSDSMALQIAKGVVPGDVAARHFKASAARSAILADQIKCLTNPEAELEEELSFAARFLQDLGGHWKGADLLNKKRLQRHLFPQGVVYDPLGSLRTAGNAFLERAKQVLVTSNFQLVDQALDDPNHELWKFLSGLRACFDEGDGDA